VGAGLTNRVEFAGTDPGMLAMFLETTEDQTTPGPEVMIVCPVCRERGVAETSDHRHRAFFLGLIPFIDSRWTSVVCPNCKRTLHSKVKAIELAVLPPERVAAAISHRASFLKASLAIIGLLVALFPFVGLAFGLLGLLVNWRHRGWTKKVCYVAVVVGAAITVVALTDMVLFPNHR
jgi:hypothetical protein